jgi:hypothetical protein
VLKTRMREDGCVVLPKEVQTFFSPSEAIEVHQHRWFIGLWRQWRKPARRTQDADSDRITRATDCETAAHRYYHLAKRLANDPRCRDVQTAMYLSGYAIECRLKSMICARFDVAVLEQAEYEYSKQAGADVQITGAQGHDFSALLRAAQVWDGLASDRAAYTDFLVINAWSTSWRYGMPDAARKTHREYFGALGRTWEWLDKKERTA